MNEKYRMLTKVVRNMKLKKACEFTLLNDNEQEALRFIIKRPLCIQNDIQSYLNVDKGLITRIVKKLVNNGYIEIVLFDDRRKKHLKATKKAEEEKLDSQLYEIAYYKRLFSDIPEQEQNQFFMTLEKIYIKSKKIRKGEITDEK